MATNPSLRAQHPGAKDRKGRSLKSFHADPAPGKELSCCLKLVNLGNHRKFMTLLWLLQTAFFSTKFEKDRTKFEHLSTRPQGLSCWLGAIPGW